MELFEKLKELKNKLYYMEKLKMQTADMAEKNIELLGQLFPNCLTEKKNDDYKNDNPRTVVTTKKVASHFDSLLSCFHHHII